MAREKCRRGCFVMSRLLICVLMLMTGLLPLTAENAQKDTTMHEWVVLPDSLQPYSAPKQESARSDNVLKAAETFRGTRLPAASDKEAWIKMEGDGGFVPFVLVIPKTHPPETSDYAIGTAIVNRETPLPLDYKPSDLVLAPEKWGYAKGRKIYLRQTAAQAMVRMFEAAKNDKIHLRVVSGYRSASLQRRLYLKKIEAAGWSQDAVAKPGHSEHQLGLAIDVSGLDPQFVLKRSFGETREGQWVRDHCEDFGFRLSYTEANTEQTGYMPEPWHLRYWGKHEAQ